MEATMMSLATLPKAPPAALYNPLEHGRALNQGDTGLATSKVGIITLEWDVEMYQQILKLR